jgi:natural product precursor
MKKLKLNRLSDQQLAEKQMNNLLGGAGEGGSQINCGCYCGCCYANQGGSSTQDNGRANQAGGLYSNCGIPTLPF